MVLSWDVRVLVAAPASQAAPRGPSPLLPSEGRGRRAAWEVRGAAWTRAGKHPPPTGLPGDKSSCARGHAIMYVHLTGVRVSSWRPTRAKG